MKELGEKFKNTREKNGVTEIEASEDLKITIEKLHAIEEGEVKEFSDVYYLKSILEEYAKYLGMNVEKVTDEFSEFLFDFTSKIPVDKIREASENKEVEIKKVVSPYTKEKTEKASKRNSIIYLIITFFVLLIAFLIFQIIL